MNQNVGIERRAEAESKRRPTAYQTSGRLPLGSTGWRSICLLPDHFGLPCLGVCWHLLLLLYQMVLDNTAKVHINVKKKKSYVKR